MGAAHKCVPGAPTIFNTVLIVIIQSYNRTYIFRLFIYNLDFQGTK